MAIGLTRYLRWMRLIRAMVSNGHLYLSGERLGFGFMTRHKNTWCEKRLDYVLMNCSRRDNQHDWKGPI